jgi:HK97 family phage major capsid protein
VGQAGDDDCVTDELAKMQDGAADAFLQRELVAALAQFSDQQFIDPTVAASPDLNPASITNGAFSIPSSGATVAAINTDVQALFAAGIAANIDYANAAWVMHPRTALFLSSLLTAGNLPMWPTISVRGGTWYGLPVVTSGAVPVDTSNDTYIVLIDASEVLLAEGTILLDASGQAAIQLDTAPSAGAQSLVNLWQNNMVGLRAERYITWLRRRDAAVAVLEDVSY